MNRLLVTKAINKNIVTCKLHLDKHSLPESIASISQTKSNDTQNDTHGSSYFYDNTFEQY